MSHEISSSIQGQVLGLQNALSHLPGKKGERYAELFTHGSLSVGVFSPRGVDTQQPHTRDEAYLVVHGSGEFLFGDQHTKFGPGDFLFVPAGIAHRFEHFTDDLVVWVIFYGPQGGEPTLEAQPTGTQRRLNIPAETKWAETLSYSRAVRVGPFVAVSQTSAADPSGNIAGGSDPYSQAVYALSKVEAALRSAGASLVNVVRTRIFLSRFDDWPEVARAHAELFGEIRPAVSLETCTMVSPDILVEFEADAVVI